jgi:PAS domain S-box-containing protein
VTSPHSDEIDIWFRTAFEHAPIGMVVADSAGRLIRANGAFARLVGRPVEELIGNDSSLYTHPDDRAVTRSTLETAPLSQRAPTNVEKRYLRPGGAVVWARTSVSSLVTADGTRYLIGTAEDVTEQKRIAEELAETRRKLRSALIAGEVATYEWEVDSDRLWGDANFDQIFATERDADGTAPLARFVAAIHPDDRDRVMAAVNHTVATGSEYDIEYRVMNGPLERWVSARGRIERDDVSGIVRFHGVVLDIHARKRAEQELQLQSRMYDTFLSGTDDLAYLIDREGRFVFANRALLDLWGLTLAEVSGKTLYQLGYPQWHADKNMREFAQLLQTKRTIRGSVPYTSPTGVEGTYEYVFSPVLDDRGEVALIAGTSRDVSERLNAAERQQQLTEQLGLALEAARMGWWQFDLATGTVSWDERTRAILGATEDHQRYEDVLLRIVPEDAVRIDAALKAAIDPHDPQLYEVEYRVRLEDGSIRWVVSRGLPVFTGQGESRRATLFVGTAIDVTDRKIADEALHVLLESERAARSEAERASRMKDEFLATLSHELRTPLSAVLGWAQILGAGGVTPEELDEGVAVIARNARVQAQIIEDLLEMSRIVSGKIRLDVQPLLLVDVVRAAIATVQAGADAKGVQISFDAAAGNLRISGDGNRLQQVFWNLLSNAVKFTPVGGTIAVKLARDEGNVEVTVTDSGPGISPDFLPFVFDRFRQADATTTRQHGGLGLGLAIVKELVELHGGTVRAVSEGAGMGARFAVRLPLVAAHQPLKESSERIPLRKRVSVGADLCEKAAGARVLVVDDESDAQGVARRFLEDCGVQVTTASSAKEAWDLLAANPFDVLVSDIGMPGEDGYSLIGKLRASGNTIPAIALTAYARPEDRVRAIAAGFQIHLAKPVDPTELVALVVRCRER